MKGRYDRGSRRERSVILDELLRCPAGIVITRERRYRVATPPGVERLPRKRREPVLVYGETRQRSPMS